MDFVTFITAGPIIGPFRIPRKGSAQDIFGVHSGMSRREIIAAIRGTAARIRAATPPKWWYSIVRKLCITEKGAIQEGFRNWAYEEPNWDDERLLDILTSRSWAFSVLWQQPVNELRDILKEADKMLSNGTFRSRYSADRLLLGFHE